MILASRVTLIAKAEDMAWRRYGALTTAEQCPDHKFENLVTSQALS